MQWLNAMTSPNQKKICELFPDFGSTFTWISLEIFKDFVSADKISVCKTGLWSSRIWLLEETQKFVKHKAVQMKLKHKY